MDQIDDYVAETSRLEEYVNTVSLSLTNNSVQLRNLTNNLENLFNLFSRNDELLGIIQDYSKNLKHDIVHIRNSYEQYENVIEEISQKLILSTDQLESMTALIQKIQQNAGTFLDSAKALAHLAKNTEIRAHHAKKEGKGLAIIAQQCLALANRVQIPFNDISIFLQHLEDLARPVVIELRKIIELSTRSRQLLAQSLDSLQTIDQTTASLREIVEQVEKNSIVNSELKTTVSKEMDVLKFQLLFSLNLIDDISVRCAQISSLSEILSTIHTIITTACRKTVLSLRDSDTSTPMEPSVIRQYRYVMNEIVRTFNQFATNTKAPLFPQEAHDNIINISQQLNEMQLSIDQLATYKENLGSGMSEVIDLESQIRSFFDETSNIYRHLHMLSDDLNDELEKIESRISATNRVFTRIKTLSVFARIEEGRSKEFNSIIAPVVQDFLDIETKTEKTFSDILPYVKQLRKTVQRLTRERMATEFAETRKPDYSKIKLFLDEIIRVYYDKQEQVGYICTTAEKLRDSNKFLSDSWKNYENSISRISRTVSQFSAYIKERPSGTPVVRKQKSIVSIHLSSDPITFKPQLKTDVTSHKIIHNFSTGLFQFGEGVGLIHGLCEDFSISEDGREYTFVLRKGIRYQNGKFLRVEHIQNALINALEGPNANLFDMIAGAKTYLDTKDVNPISIKIINNFTLKITLEYPYLPFLANLATNIADPYIDEELPIGVGPYRIVSWEKGKRIILAANEHYFEGRPSIDELHFVIIKNELEAYELFKTGVLSLYEPTTLTLHKLKSETPHLIHTLPELSIQHLCMNCQQKPFNNRDVRKAMAHAIDKHRLVDALLKGFNIEAKGLFPPSMKVYNYNLEGLTFNPRLSRELLRKAGYPNGLPGVYPLDINNSPTMVKRAEFIQSNLANVGIHISINPLSWSQLLEKTYSGNSLLSLRGWLNDNGDPDNFVYPLFHSSSHGRAGNTFFFSSSDIDTEIINARRIRNISQRILLYRQIEEKIVHESPTVFLLHGLKNLAIQQNIMGIKPHPLGLVRSKYLYRKSKQQGVHSDNLTMAGIKDNNHDLVCST